MCLMSQGFSCHVNHDPLTSDHVERQMRPIVVTAMVVAATSLLAATSPASADEAVPTADQVSAAKLGASAHRAQRFQVGGEDQH